MPSGAEIDVAHEMMLTTFDVILRTMLPGRGGTNIRRSHHWGSIYNGAQHKPAEASLGAQGSHSLGPHRGHYSIRGRVRFRAVVVSQPAEAAGQRQSARPVRARHRGA